MALELAGRAVVGAVFGELLKAVLDAKDKASNFRNILARIEDTLKAIIPRLDEISGLNHKLDLQQKQMQELVALIESGKALILKCSKISTFNLVKKLQYSKELLHLDNTLLRYFMTILQLDQSRDNKELLVMVRELHMKLAIDKDETISNHQSESIKPGKDLGSGSHKAGKLHQDFKKVEDVKLYNNCKMESHVKLVDSKDGGISKKSESVRKPKESSGGGVKEARKLCQSSEKGEARNLYQESIKEAAPEFYQDSIKEEYLKLHQDFFKEESVDLHLDFEKEETLNLYQDSNKVEASDRYHNFFKVGEAESSSHKYAEIKHSGMNYKNEAGKLYQSSEKGESRNLYQESIKEPPPEFFQDSMMEEYLKLYQDFLKEESVELHLDSEKEEALNLYQDSKKEEASDWYHNFFEVGMPVDPLDPPKFKNKRMPKASGSPAVPVMHSPPRPVTVKEQHDWKTPPCISNWKNPKGYTIPLDKRLAADGRGLQEIQINEDLAMLSESLYVVEQKARDAVAMRSKVQKEMLMKENESKEQELRVLAQKARSERIGSAHSAAVSMPSEKRAMDRAEARKLYQSSEKGEARNHYQESIKEAASEFYQYSNKEEYLQLYQDPTKEESAELYLDSEKERAPNLFQDFKKDEAGEWYYNSEMGESKSSCPKYVEIKQSGTNFKWDAGKVFWLENKSHYLNKEALNSILVKGGLSSGCEFLCNRTYGTSYRYDNTKFLPLIIKRLKEVKVGEREFKQQIEILKKVGKHPNIQIPKGYYFSAEGKLLLYNFGVTNSLYQVLHEDGFEDISFGRPSYFRPRRDPPPRGFRLCWKSRVKIALETAMGIQHLHSVKLIHGNIESSNVLLTCQIHVFLWDFSLEPIMNLSAATSGYRAPEFIETGEATQESDVYSFGIMLLEILCGRRPDKCDLLGRAYEHMMNQNYFFYYRRLFDRDYKEEEEEMMGIAMHDGHCNAVCEGGANQAA